MLAIGALALTMGVTTLSASTVKADENVNYEQYERSAVNNINASFSGRACWRYLYTIEPYSYYQNSLTKERRSLVTTSYTNHTINTIVSGWATQSTSWPIPTYNPAYANLMGGCP